MKFAVSLAWRVRSGDAPPPDPAAGETNLTATGTLSGTSATVSQATGDMRAGVEVTAEAGVAVAAGTAGQPTVKVYERRDARPNKRKMPKKKKKEEEAVGPQVRDPGWALHRHRGVALLPMRASVDGRTYKKTGCADRAWPSGGFSGPKAKPRRRFAT